ncbi:MAG: hypothetical protein ACK5LK_04965 [Chthoniobacterales bacterium]
MIQSRNLTSHTYHQDLAREIANDIIQRYHARFHTDDRLRNAPLAKLDYFHRYISLKPFGINAPYYPSPTRPGPNSKRLS